MLSPPAGTIDDGLRALYPLLRATCHTVLRGTGYVDYAEDAAQLAALLLWRHWTAFLPVRGTREAWAATIAHHAAIDLLRWHQRRTAVPLFEALDGAMVDDALDAVLDRVLIAQAQHYLTPAEREMLPFIAAGDSQREMAEAIPMPLGTVKTRLYHLSARVARRMALARGADGA